MEGLPQMQMISNQLETLTQRWEAFYRYGTREERIERAGKWLPYYSFLSKQAAGQPFDFSFDPTGFVSTLICEGILKPDDTLLEIGAGNGDFALRLAKHCRHVTALEMNPAGITLMQRRAADYGIGNINMVCALWEQYEPEQVFDVTFISMCPAICNIEEILKMEAATRRTCCIVTVLPGSYDYHRRAMMKELELHPAGMMTDGDRYREILTAMGRNVRVFSTETVSRHDLTLDQILAQYSVYFGIFGISERDAQTYLRGYFMRNAENGILHDERRMRLALVTWNVN